MATNQAQKNLAYDNAVYLARQTVWLTPSTAGANGTFGKYYAKGNEILLSAGAIATTLGAATSSYTQTTTVWTTAGTSLSTLTTVVNTWTAAQTCLPYRVNVTGTTTTTTTFSNNSFVCAAANSTNGTVAYNNFSSMAAAGSYGGVALAAGDFLYMLGGTDTAAVVVPYYEIAYQPLANIPS